MISSDIRAASIVRRPLVLLGQFRVMTITRQVEIMAGTQTHGFVLNVTACYILHDDVMPTQNLLPVDILRECASAH